MDTTSFISTLTQAKQGNTQAQELLIHKFLPLIRKYAYKCHAMEFEDAQQELIFALLAAVHSITYIQNEGECIRYLQKGILNYFKYLCRTSIRHKEYEQISANDNFTMLPSYSDFSLIDLSPSLAQYMKSLSPTRQRILQYALIDEYSSSEIAAKMQLSVQYANRIKRNFWQKGGNLHEIRAHNTATVILDDHLDQRQISGTWDVAPVPFIPYVH